MLQAGGAAEALIEQYNDQLREIREQGLADTDAAEPLRELLRALRDQPRITEGSVKVCRLPRSPIRGPKSRAFGRLHLEDSFIKGLLRQGS